MMAVKEFNFTKDWNDAADFPAIAASTKQARQNIQLLHDETKAYLNETVKPVLDKAALLNAGPGLDGQYAVSDGRGGIRWETLINRGITGG